MGFRLPSHSPDHRKGTPYALHRNPNRQQRLQQMDLDDVAKLAAADPADILQQGALLTGSSCWKNSPQAKAAITAAVEWARTQQDGEAA